jgi:hypothetical protein
VLSLYYCRFVLFVHAFDGLASISIDVLITRFDGIFDVDDLLFSEVFEVHAFSSTYLLLVLIYLYFHFVYKADPDRV